MLLLNNHNVKQRFAREEASVSASAIVTITTLATHFIAVFQTVLLCTKNSFETFSRGAAVSVANRISVLAALGWEKCAPYGPAELVQCQE